MADNTKDMSEITAYEIKRGFMLGWVRLVECPDWKGVTVCSIGWNPDLWFYFGGDDAEEQMPFEYASTHDLDAIADRIAEILRELGEYSPDEWAYYRYVLNND